jgi:hypothetical protein
VLANFYEGRGKHKSVLCLVYSIKAKEDFVLRSYLEYLHFLYAESDPLVRNISYTAERCKITVLGEDLVALLDASVQLSNGRTQWREVKSSNEVEQGVNNRAHLQKLIQEVASHQEGVDYARLTENELCAQPHRLRNWNRIIPWIAQAREWPLVEEKGSVLHLMKQEGSISYGELFQLLVSKYGSRFASLYIAGTFDLVSKGKISSDLDVTRFTKKTRLWTAEQ